MGDMLSQEEINALLKGMDEDEATSSGIVLSAEDKEAIGKISNISMGTAAMTLIALINQKVTITTPTVSTVCWADIKYNYLTPSVAIQITYTSGFTGANLLILKERDVAVITNLMMGGDGTQSHVDLSDFHLSAIGEAMNQMIGSAATSMSSMFNKKIDIAAPDANLLDLSQSFDPTELAEFLGGDFIMVSFRLQIGNLVDSEMIQLYPLTFVDELMNNSMSFRQVEETTPEAQPTLQPQQRQQQQSPIQQKMNTGMNQGVSMHQQGPMAMNEIPSLNPTTNMNQDRMNYNDQFRNVEAQQAQFQNFDMASFIQQKENIDLIMDVPLEVTVELGCTSRLIKEILEFAPGSIIELNQLAGEPINVLVNGKVVAKGEIVVIEENFSVRLTEIIKDNAHVL